MEPNPKEYYHTLFEYAPISLWEEDYSGILRLFEELRARGVQSLEAYLADHPDFVDACMRRIVVREVNQQTLVMFGAPSQETFLARLDQVFGDGMRHHMRSELLALWNGELSWSGDGINYTLRGEPLDILLHWRILPGSEQTWEHVLVTIENITARVRAERRLQNLFEASPISLWEEDYSAVKAYFDDLRRQGVHDLEEHLHNNPQVVTDCMRLIKVLSVNQRTLELFGADSQEYLLANLDQIFRDEMTKHFARELVDLWNGHLVYEREGINYTLSGEALYIQLNFRVMPGHEEDFAWVLVAIQDITVRKKAEQYLRYLGTHDVMTGLYNRAYFQETLTQLEKERPKTLSVIIADLNDLKVTNDTRGHQAGDNLIRRAAEVLKTNFDEECVVARIGGDEFAILMPGVDTQHADEAVERLRLLVDLNNQYYRDPQLGLAIGAATCQAGQSLEKMISLADDAMYTDKAAQRRTSHPS
ncbi:MAG: sensor domain-containing diguanylate cyclase [Anaerolineales bacterium]|nr:sensor domain-containing diguanylate cyclase [Anaerolineales bacterium]